MVFWVSKVLWFTFTFYAIGSLINSFNVQVIFNELKLIFIPEIHENKLPLHYKYDYKRQGL